jgi:PKD repeat protein
LTVQFTDQSTGSITNWSWTFGDGGTSIEKSPFYTYQDPGIYTVSLSVTGPGGSHAETKADYITVTVPPPPPTAAFLGVPTSGDAPLAVQFTDQSTGSISSWLWDFGDGETSTAQHPTHTYESGGDYTVGLTVTGPGGEDTSTATDYISVTEPAQTELEVFFDSFESWGDWTANWSQDSQSDWRRSTSRRIEGNYAAEVDGRARDAQLISVPIDLQGKNNATITFWWYIESGLDTGEYLAFDVSADGGAWQAAASLRGNVDAENMWHNVSIDMNGINDLAIRFMGTMSRSSEDAYVDAVRVIAW